MHFADLLREHKISYHDSGRNTRRGWLNLKCPFCGKEPYLGYNIAGRYTNCWNCGRHQLWEVIHLLTHLPKSECIALVGELPREYTIESLKSGTLRIPEGLTSLVSWHRNYLEGRGFKPHILEDLWEIKALSFATVKPELRWRVWIPIHLDGEVVSWTTRAIGDRQPKYLSARDSESAVPISKLLYGWDYVRHGTILVHEGPIDVWRSGPGSVAIMGLRVSPAQLNKLSKIPNRFICFDNEDKAQQRARKLCDDLSVFPGSTKNVILSSGKDIAEASDTEVGRIKTLLNPRS